MAEYSTFEAQLEEHGNLLFTNVGQSMLPLLRQGRDLMLIEKKTEQRCRKYDVVLYKRPADGHYILHRVLKVRPEDYVIAGDHNTFLEYGITDREILGVMTAIIRGGKRIAVTDRRYLLYVHLWCGCYPVRMFFLKCGARLMALRHRIATFLRSRMPGLYRLLKRK